MATILIVDDKAANRSLLTTLLGYSGHRIVEASNGYEAIERTLSEHPDLTITDILMPGMDGYELVRKLRDLDAENKTKFIFYSSTYLESEAQALARACGVNRVICKPAEPELILRIVDETLASPHLAAEHIRDNGKFHDNAIRVLNEKLFHKVEEVEELNRTLEQRIEQRTAELEDANAELKKEALERRKAEEESVRTRERQLKMKGEFLSHVSHELRSPLAVVHQFTTILLDGLGGEINPDQREYLQISLRNVNQLKLMIDDLLEASRADTNKLSLRRSSIALAELATHTMASVARAAADKQIKLSFQSKGDLPAAYADSGRIGQVLTNLLDNAVKFSPPDGTITVSVDVCPDDPGFLRVSVADCGCGIEPQHAQRVFDRLYQITSPKEESRRGLGLGLYICKELVDLHGGHIWVDETRSGGATFHFTLPVFSIRSLITPIAFKHGQPISSLVLLTIRVNSKTSETTDNVRERTLHRIHQVLEKCMLPDLDVLLPMQSNNNFDFFSIVARTDQRGSDVMASRIREQLSANREGLTENADFSISSELIELHPLAKELAPANWIATTALILKEKMTANVNQ